MRRFFFFFKHCVWPWNVSVFRDSLLTRTEPVVMVTCKQLLVVIVKSPVYRAEGEGSGGLICFCFFFSRVKTIPARCVSRPLSKQHFGQAMPIWFNALFVYGNCVAQWGIFEDTYFFLIWTWFLFSLYLKYFHLMFVYFSLIFKLSLCKIGLCSQWLFADACPLQ